ncbi:MAG: cob(I)yrinic acid a,c-diamide adenosyltransferase [Clostridiaceae bacterium]|nr:cob(I)yrinic acid a,c-diamide adenosyltransferase [Clostridiaceae bacterium]
MIQIYTGDGKGKTTAALGQGLRASGSGMKVIMLQFLKGGSTGELESIKYIENFNIVRFEKERDFVWNLSEEEIEELKGEIQKGYDYAIDVIKNNKCDMLILDEIMGVLQNNFLTEEQVLKLFNENKSSMEIILTGRNVPQKIIEKADLVTEMKAIKHYFDKGVPARKGIEY